MTTARRSRGPWTHRLLIYSFSIAFGVLVYWLLSFVVNDIATWPGPDYQAIEKSILDQTLVARSKETSERIEDTEREIASRKQRQQVLRDSTSNSERTMNQLLEFRRMSIQKGVTPTQEEAKALADSQSLFLVNQTKYQEMNDQIAALSDELVTLQNQQRATERSLETQRPAVQEKYNRLHARHQWRLAALKLAFLLPLLLVAVWLFLKKRAALYGPLIYAFGLATVLKVTMVMHEHFPKRYFKYILILAALVLVTRVLIYLLRAMAFPKTDWLLKQYREAYERFVCPICTYPIRRGPLKHLFWTRSSVKKLRVPAGIETTESDKPYVCPSCATALFEECPSCKNTRHSLLPACTQCGAVKKVEAQNV